MKQAIAFSRLMQMIMAFLLTALLSGHAVAERTAAGTEFIFPVTPKAIPGGVFQVLVAAGEAGTATVSVPGLDFSRQVTLVPGTVARVSPPHKAYSDLTHDTVKNRSLHVLADVPVKVYVEQFLSKNSDAFLALPVQGLGKRYRTVSYIALSRSTVTITATEDDTRVTITPGDNTVGHPDGVPFDVLLDRFESYHLVGRTTYYFDENQIRDLSGSLIVADKPVAVGSGNGCTYVPYRVPSCDHLTEMMPPVESWGRRVMTAPLAGRLAGDLIRVMADEDDTVVFRNGEELARLSAGEYIDTIVAEPSLFEAEKPILVTQYSVGQAFDRTATDPFMMIAVPAEQYLGSYTVSTAKAGFSANYLGLIIPASAVDTISLDGGPLPAVSFAAVPGTEYVSAAVPVSLGVHNITADEPFGLYVYGFSDADSYGYPGGMGLERINGTDSDFSEVSLDVRVPADGVSLIEDSFTQAPDTRNTDAQGESLGWRWDAFSVGDQQTVAFDLNMPGPQPGENRVLLSDVQLSYRDLAGTTHQRNLGPQAVQVLDTWLDSYLTVTPEAVSRGDAVTLTAGFESLSDVTNAVNWQLVVEDDSGALVGIAGEGQASLAPGQSLPLTSESFSTDGLYGGDYLAVLAGHDDDGTLLSRSQAPFTVTVPPASEALDGRLSLDQIDYQPGEELALDVRLANDAVGQILSDLSVVVTIEGADGDTRWSHSYTLSQLLPGSADNYHAQVSLAGWQPGEYRALLEVRDDAGAVVYTEQDDFTLASSADSGAGVTGTLSLGAPSVLRTEALQLSASVTNAGNSIISDIPLRLRVLDPASGDVIAVYTETLPALDVDQSHVFSRSWVADVPAAGIYVASLVAEFPAGERPLGFAGFSVEERFDLAMSFAPPAELLVLMDPAECSATAVDVSVTLPTLLVAGDVLDVSLHDANGALLDSERHQVGVEALPLNTVAGAGLDLAITGVAPDRMTLAVVGDGNVDAASVRVTLTRSDDVSDYASSGFAIDCNAAMADSSLFSFRPQPVDGAPLASAERLALEQALTASGWSYRITTDTQRFGEELATGAYPVVALFNAQLKIPESLQHTLRNDVANGLGLFVAGKHDMRNGRITDALGIKIRGKLPKAQGWRWQDTWLPAGDNPLDQAAFPLRVEATGATVMAHLYQRGKGGLEPAVTHNAYGYGQSAFMAFDVLSEMVLEGVREEQADSATAWLLAALDSLRPAAMAPEAGSVQQVRLSLADRGAGGWVLLALPLPQGYSLADAGNGRLLENTLYWPVELGETGPLEGYFTVTLPGQPEQTLWQPEIQVYVPGTGWVAYGQLEFALDVVEPTLY